MDSVFEFGTETLGKVIIVDNDSSDNTLNVAEAFGHQEHISCIKNRQNIGFSKANNQGIQECTSKYIVILNPDTKMLNNALYQLVNIMEQNPEIGILGPQLVSSTGKTLFGFGLKPTTFRIMLEFMFGRYVRYFIYKTFKNDKNIFEIDWVSAACFICRKSLVDNIGGFDENIFMYSEDVDLCLRAQKMDFKISLDPRIKVVHYSGKSRVKNFEQALFSNIKARLYYASKHLKKIDKLVLIVFFHFFLMSRILVYSILQFISEKNKIFFKAYSNTFIRFVKNYAK